MRNSSAFASSFAFVSAQSRQKINFGSNLELCALWVSLSVLLLVQLVKLYTQSHTRTRALNLGGAEKAKHSKSHELLIPNI